MSDETRAIEENLFAFFPLFRHLPRSETVLDTDLMCNITDIPFPLFNSIMRAQLTPERVEPAILGVIERGRSRKVPLLWWTGPATRPADLGRSLQAHGFVHEGNAPGMAVEIETAPERTNLPAEFMLSEIQKVEDLGTWCRTAALGFEMPDFVRVAWVEWFTGIGLNRRGPLFHFLGFWKGEPVATASVFLDGKSAGLYNIAVIPEARGRGFGAAMTIAPLIKARSMGYRLGILHSTEMGVPLYQKIGFKEYCRIGHYIRSFDGDL